MVRVMDSAVFREDVLIYPFTDFGSRDKPGIRQPVFASEVDGRVWSAIVIFSHAEQSSGNRRYLLGNFDTNASTNLYKTLSMAF